MSNSMTITRIGAMPKSIDEAGKVTSARLMVTGTITMEITTSVFIDDNADDDSTAELLASFEPGKQVQVFQKEVNGKTFWNVQRPSMGLEAVMATLKAAPVTKKAKPALESPLAK